MNRGSSSEPEPRRTNGGGFNEAPIHESGKFQIQVSEIPWIEASMRPRFMNRGSIDRLAVRVGQRGASMRPRFMNRGSPTSIDR